MPKVVPSYRPKGASGARDRRHATGSKQIAIRFDDATFARIQHIAQSRHMSFASVVRLLVEAGLDVREDVMLRIAETIALRDAA